MADSSTNLRLPRRLLLAGPFTFTDIHGSLRTAQDRADAATLLRKLTGLTEDAGGFELWQIATADIAECSLISSGLEGKLPPGLFDHAQWVADGADDAVVERLFLGGLAEMLRDEPEDAQRIAELAELYRRGVSLDPLIAVAVPAVALTSSRDSWMILIDGNHRAVAALLAGVPALPVYVRILSRMPA